MSGPINIVSAFRWLTNKIIIFLLATIVSNYVTAGLHIIILVRCLSFTATIHRISIAFNIRQIVSKKQLIKYSEVK